MNRVLVFSFFCIIFVFTEASKEHDKFIRILKEIRFRNGVAPKVEKITGYREDLEDTASQLASNFQAADELIPYYLSKNVAFFLGVTDIVIDSWSTDNLTKILQDVLKQGLDFLFDEAYEATSLSFVDHPDIPKGKQLYILLFSLSKEAVVASMPRRVRSIRRFGVPYLKVYQDRLCTQANPELNQLAKIVRKDPSQVHLLKNKETYGFVNVSVPKSCALSWDQALAYLLWHCDEAKSVASTMLDTKNVIMGMDFEWKFDTTNKDEVSSVDVTMIFEKICTTGDKSYYLPLLEVLKNARLTKPVPDDRLVNVYPGLRANTSAENCAIELGMEYLEFGVTIPDKVHLHAMKHFDPSRYGDPAYELEVFKEVLQDWIKKAESNPQICGKLYSPYQRNVGFGITIVREPQGEGKPNPAYWSVSLTLY